MAHENDPQKPLSRRSFLMKGTMGTLAGFAGAQELIARPVPSRPKQRRTTPIANCAVIGYGPWGRELASTLDRMEEANLVAVCDEFNLLRRRAQRDIPNATWQTDYRTILDDSNITAVFIATATHEHRALVEEALAAGKHVYCEAPLANTIEDARAIAQAAAAHPDQAFQTGMLYRTEPQHRDVFGFIRSGAIGNAVMARSQWHSKESWRQASSNREREQRINWRLDEDKSIGLVGEYGVHNIDKMMWILNSTPVSVTGIGNVKHWDDGRTIPDTVQAIIGFENGVQYIFHASLATSFDRSYDMFYGTDSTIMMRDQKAWMFKEVDAPLLGWEVYARKDKFYKEKGIALLANATQLDAQDLGPTDDIPGQETPTWYAMKAFMDNIEFGPYPSPAGPEVAFAANVVAIKAHEAIMGNTTVTFAPEDFAI